MDVSRLRRRGILFILSAPSGAGKTTISTAALASIEGLEMSISLTTRSPRAGEKNGQHYTFVSREEFERRRDGGELAEWAEVHGNRYGTAQSVIREALARGQDLVLEIDWQGAQQVRRLLPEAVGIFILPPSRAALEERLHKRGQDKPEVIAQRLAGSREEISHVGEFDFVIVNERFDTALDDLGAIVRAHRLRRAALGERLDVLVQSLLA